METKLLGRDGIGEAAEVLRRGGLVAFPTETVYGLGGDALDPEASRKIYAAKGRPSDNPLIVHVSGISEVPRLVKELTEPARKLMEAFWPGPLTLVLPKSELVPPETTGGLSTVALRCPENAVTLELIRLSGVPLAGPSANSSGKPSPTEAEHVYHDLKGKIEIILDDGPVGIGVESAIIDMTEAVPTLLRPGAVTPEELSEVLGQPVAVDPAIIAGTLSEGIHPKAPGMKYRHYAPEAEMTMVTTRARKEAPGMPLALWARGDEAVYRRMLELANADAVAGKSTAILCSEEALSYFSACLKGPKLYVLGKRSEPLTMTRNLFRVLREFDREGIRRVVTESYPSTGLGFALMNRLGKACGQREDVVHEEK